MKTGKLMMALLLGAMMSFASAMRISKEKGVSIVHGANAPETELEAAKELQDYLHRICGATCAVVPEGEPLQGPAIYVGETAVARREVPDYGKLGQEEWVIRNVGENLLLCGGRPRGTLYAVFELLERLGVIWPNETMEYVPAMEEILLEGLDIREKPALMQREIYGGLPSPGPSAQRFFAHNKMNRRQGMPERLGGGILFGSPRPFHTFHAYTQPDWPDEYFSLNEKGVRVRSTSAHGPGQLCPTNPDLQKAMAARLREFIQEDRAKLPREKWPVTYDISQNDCKCPCQCETCRRRTEEEGGSYAGALLDLINYVANDIADDYPDILVQTSCTSWSLVPTKNKPARNVVMRLAKGGCEFKTEGNSDTLAPVEHPFNKVFHDKFTKWSAIADNLFIWDYWIVFQKVTNPPYLNARSLSRDIKFYRDNHVKGMFVECERAMDTSFFQLKLWLGLKMMQNPDQDYDTLLEKFCRASYGPAARPMRELIEYLQDRREQSNTVVGLAETIVKRPYIEGTSSPDMPDILPYTDRAFYERANALLDEAEELAKESPDHLACVRRERIPIDNALLNSFAKYADNPPCGRLVDRNYKAIYDRNEANLIAQADYFYHKAYPRENGFKDTMEQIKMSRLMAFTDKESLPAELQGRQARIFPWTAIRTVSGSTIVKDVEAFGGRAASLAKPASSRALSEYYAVPFKMGVHTSGEKQSPIILHLSEAEIPQDEKYHLIHLGRCEIKPKTLIFPHWTWLLQVQLGGVHVPGGDNEWDVYVSLKFTGEPYVKGSKTEPGLYCDRAILVK